MLDPLARYWGQKEGGGCGRNTVWGGGANQIKDP